MLCAGANMAWGVTALFNLPGWVEVAIVILAILLLFGGRKLPELARGLARGMRVFRDELHGVKTDLDSQPQAKESGGEKAQAGGDVAAAEAPKDAGAEEAEAESDQGQAGESEGPDARRQA